MPKSLSQSSVERHIAAPSQTESGPAVTAPVQEISAGVAKAIRLCVDCAERIPARRIRLIGPGVERCMPCQNEFEKGVRVVKSTKTLLFHVSAEEEPETDLKTVLRGIGE